MTVVKVLGGYLEVEGGGIGGGGEPPGIWPSPGHPAHPIAPGGPPPGIWGPNDPRPTPPIYYPGAPGQPPGVINGGPGSLPPWVMPPIAPGGQPPGIWGGKPPEWVDNTLPPDQPVAGWPPTIMPPIFYPPDVPPVETPPEGPVEWHTGWTPEKGWVVVGIVTPEGPSVTPSTAGSSRRGKG